jgi:hypothetical protein
MSGGAKTVANDNSEPIIGVDYSDGITTTVEAFVMPDGRLYVSRIITTPDDEASK